MRNYFVFSTRPLVPYLCTKMQGYGTFFNYWHICNLLHIAVAENRTRLVWICCRVSHLLPSANLLQRQRADAHFQCVIQHAIKSCRHLRHRLATRNLFSRQGRVQQFIFYFSNGTDSLERTYAVIYCKQQPVLSAADLASSNYITNYLTRLVYRGAKKTGGYFISGSHSKDDEGINEGINEL